MGGRREKRLGLPEFPSPLRARLREPARPGHLLPINFFSGTARLWPKPGTWQTDRHQENEFMREGGQEVTTRRKRKTSSDWDERCLGRMEAVCVCVCVWMEVKQRTWCVE